MEKNDLLRIIAKMAGAVAACHPGGINTDIINEWCEELDALREEVERNQELFENVEYWLKHTQGTIRVLEGFGAENISKSFSVSVAKLTK